jgi:SH3-like domain-containing protein
LVPLIIVKSSAINYAVKIRDVDGEIGWIYKDGQKEILMIQQIRGQKKLPQGTAFNSFAKTN